MIEEKKRTKQIRDKEEDRQVIRSARKDKREYQANIIKKSKEAVRKHYLKTRKKMSRRADNDNVAQVRDKGGNLLKKIYA